MDPQFGTDSKVVQMLCTAKEFPTSALEFFEFHQRRQGRLLLGMRAVREDENGRIMREMKGLTHPSYDHRGLSGLVYEKRNVAWDRFSSGPYTVCFWRETKSMGEASGRQNFSGQDP